VAFIVMSAIVVAYLARSTERAPNGVASQGAPDQLQLKRLVYPYSVVPGGVQDAIELRTAILSDPVVAQHYKGFDVDSATPIRIPTERLAYVSYRLGNRIYWTNHPVRLARDEQVLTDGTHLIRSRCGNRISFERQSAGNSPAEPTEAEMDLLADSFSDATVILPWNEDGVIVAPPIPGRNSNPTPAVPTGTPTRASGNSTGGAAGFRGTGSIALVVSSALSPALGPAAPPTGTTGTVLPIQSINIQIQLLLLISGSLGPQSTASSSSIFGLPTVSSLPVWSGTPIDVLPGISISTSAPMAPAELSVTPLLDSPYIFAPGLSLDATAVPPVDQAPTPTTPEPGTYLLTGTGLLLLIAAFRKSLTYRQSG
jgi:hypothetical protein